MRIKGLTPFMLNNVTTTRLKNTTVVIDGQSVFFRLYKESRIPYAFGCESDEFAKYLKEYLTKFKKANLDCHFVFKGGHTDKEKLDIHYEAENRLHGRDYIPAKQHSYDDIIKPLFAKDIWFQTLEEMGFKYIACNGDHVTECIALALKLSCPLIGNNMQYFFSLVQYVPEINTVLDENDNLLCGIHMLSNFLRIHSMTEEKVILFIMITDKHIFTENIFSLFFQRKQMLSRYGNIIFIKLVNWLAQRSTEQALREILQFISKSDQATFMEKKSDLTTLMQKRKSADTKSTLYVTDRNAAKFTQSDPEWFEKGVFFKYIPIPYVNLYRFKIDKASNFIEDYDQENSVMISIDIFKYAYDLLTNFEGGEISVEHKNRSSPKIDYTLMKCNSSILKPDYEATVSVFENGFDDIKELKLFEHFVTETLQTFDFESLNKAPADCRLLLVALVYYSRKRPDVKLEVYSILLSYVMLNVVFEKTDGDDDRSKSKTEYVADKPLLDSFTDKDLVTAADCDVAYSIMDKYFKLRFDELCDIFDRKALHPLVEFQRCFEELNFLNQLCGSQFERTLYRKTYNGTFVYKILRAMRNSESQDGFQFIQKKLNPAPTVLAFLSGIIEVYESILYEY